MLASLKIEAIGDNYLQMVHQLRSHPERRIYGHRLIPSPGFFVAEITGKNDKFKWERKFLRSKKDYTCSNSVGSRGVFVFYELESGRVYDVKKPITWKRVDRFFCRVNEAGEIIEINESEIEQWLIKKSSL